MSSNAIALFRGEHIMAHKCFISYKKEDQSYKDTLVDLFDSAGVDVIDKSLDRTIDSEDGDYVMRYIREHYLADSTVTVFIIGHHSSENEGYDWSGRRKNYFIEHELQASLYNGKGNTRSGIVGLVLPSMYSSVYQGTNQCKICGNEHNVVIINDSTAIREFSYNYYCEPHDGCAWSEDERYCILVKWDDFVKSPEKYIDEAYDKRFSAISEKIRIRNLR